MSRLLIKKLAATELILFKSLFDIRTELGISINTKQKAISPPVELFSQIYPNISDDWKGRIDLRVFGPGPDIFHFFPNRSLARQDKNWRIEGDINDLIIGSPYIRMRPGDYAILDFHGEDRPETVDIYLLSAADTGDQALLSAVIAAHRHLANRKRSRTSKAACIASAGDILALLNPYEVPDGHVLLKKLVGAQADTIEEEVAEGQERSAEIRRRSGWQPLDPDKFRLALQRRELIGRQGEILVNRWLEAGHGRYVSGHRWVSNDFPGMPYDFEVYDLGGNATRLEVKSTSGAFDSPFRMSRQELHAGTEQFPYSIARVFEISTPAPGLRIAHKINRPMKSIVKGIILPDRTALGEIWIQPAIFNFVDEETFDPRLL